MMRVGIPFFFFFVLATTVTLAAFSSPNMPKQVAVVGSTGQLGRRAVDQLLNRKIPVKALVRQENPPDFLLEKQKQHPDLLEFVTGGDITSVAKVKELLTDCSQCLALHGATRRAKWYELLTASEGSEDSDKSHAKQVNYESMKIFLQCAQETGCQHIVRITGKGEDPWSFFSVLINGLGSMAKGWNYEGEVVLRSQSAVDYTIIRPGIMKTDFEPNGVHLKLADNGGDLKVSAVSYDQIAELSIESILQPEARRTTLTAMNVDGDDNSSLVERLKQVNTDTRDFPKSLIAEHKRSVKVVFTSLAAAVLAVVAGILVNLFR